ncbi:MAG: hypothetical protein CMI06_01200 [Oceanospirillaceae bacterium]|jgi:hypothetical protein|nr:hypothetical protein [Oceanospirillaceae bacterium]|tara:strand:- start:185 stop:1477 length:1293 start_codon:yes stop_codon:yes gene_type:complete
MISYNKSNIGSLCLLYFWLVAFKLILEASYVFILVESFTYVGYSLEFDVFRYVSSWLFYCIFFFYVKASFAVVMDYLSITAVVALICPLLVLYGLDSARSFYPVFISMFSVLVIFLSYRFFMRQSLFSQVPRVKYGKSIAIFISSFFVAYLFAWYPLSGVSYNLSFSDVYEYRRQNHALSDFGLLAYLNFWVLKVFSVFVLAYSLLRKRYALSLLMVLVFVSYYAANTHKSVLFTPFLVIGIWFYFSKYSKIYFFPMAMFFIILLSIFTFFYLDDVWLSALFPNRVFLIPAHLTFSYFDFFSSNDYLFFSNSFLSSYFEYPYDKPLSYLIGDYAGNPGAAANNGYISSGFAQGGVFICLIYSVLIGMLLSVIDRPILLGQIPAWFALALFVVPMRDFLINMDLLTTILTGGMFWAVILIYLSREKAVLRQ